jgi:hypothetical protein
MQVPWQAAYVWVLWIFVSVIRITYSRRPSALEWKASAACMPVLITNAAFLATGMCNPNSSTQALMIASGVAAASVLVRTTALAETPTEFEDKRHLHATLLATSTHLACMLGLALAQQWGGCTAVTAGAVTAGFVAVCSVAMVV